MAKLIDYDDLKDRFCRLCGGECPVCQFNNTYCDIISQSEPVDAIPRETINAMIGDILKFKNEVEKNERIEFSKSYAAGMQQALEIIYKFTYNGGNDVKT